MNSVVSRAVGLEEDFQHLYRTYFGEMQHERAEIETLPRLLKGVDLFIDVGASLGQYTYFANRVLSGGKIIALEPDPDRFAELSKNCRKWARDGNTEIVAIQAAVSDVTGTTSFSKTGSRISGGLFPVDERPASYSPVEVRQIVLDEFFRRGVETFVKIDVEGSEIRALLGATELIDSGVARFLTEITWWGDRERGYTPLTFLRFLYHRGLEVRKNTSRRNSSFLVLPVEGRRPSLLAYMRVAPVLVAKSFWGRYIPRRVRASVERLLGQRRVRNHADSEIAHATE